MAHLQRTEERLIERARSGDRRAQQSLWHAHRRWVAAIILAHRPRNVEVDDLMQETALKYLAKLDTLRDAGAFRPWLRRIAINICRGSARSYRPTLGLAEDTRVDSDDRRPGRDVVPETRETPPDGVVAACDAAQRLMAQALTLPPDYREPLLLRCVQSLSYQQISAILEVPVTTVETRLARARRMLREELGEAPANGRPPFGDRAPGARGRPASRTQALEEGA
jgi:RNA polymerase sigma-70 factor (ECF subfamily)